MAIPTRHANPDQVKAGARTFFVTSSAWGKRNFLQSDRAAELFLRVLYDYSSAGKISAARLRGHAKPLSSVAYRRK